MESGGLLAALNTELTESLIAEGRVRELVRFIQEARKKAELEVTDRIRLRLEAPDDLAAALQSHRDYIADETLAVEIAALTAAERETASVVTIDEHEVRFVIERVE